MSQTKVNYTAEELEWTDYDHRGNVKYYLGNLRSVKCSGCKMSFKLDHLRPYDDEKCITYYCGNCNELIHKIYKL